MLVSIQEEQIAAFCRKHHIRKLSLFGSVLRDDFNANSDVDVLVEFEPGQSPGFIGLGFMEAELSELFDGREVDLVTAKFLNLRIRGKILAEARVLYEG